MSVAHPDGKYIYQLVEIKADMAVVFIAAHLSKTGEDITREFPSDEVFEVKVAQRIAQELKAHDILDVLADTDIISAN